MATPSTAWPSSHRPKGHPVKITINPADFKEIVNYAQTAINNRYSQTIMTGMLFATGDGELRATGATMEAHASATAKADVFEPGRILIPGASIGAAASRLRGKAEIQISTTETQAIIAQGAKVFTINLMPLEEYPQGITNPLPVVGTVNGAEFAETIHLVEGAAAGPNSEPAILTGIFLRTTGDRIHATATDRYRIAMADTEWSTDGETDENYVVSAEWLRVAVKAIGAETTIHSNGKQFAITSGGYTTSTILMNGEYPKVASLFTNIESDRHQVDRKEFLDAVDTVSVMAERNTPVRLKAKNGVITIDAGGVEGSGIAQIRTDNESAFEIAIQPTFLLWTLRTHGTEHVEFIPNGGKPIKFTGSPNTEHLVMPVRLPEQH